MTGRERFEAEIDHEADAVDAAYEQMRDQEQRRTTADHLRDAEREIHQLKELYGNATIEIKEWRERVMDLNGRIVIFAAEARDRLKQAEADALERAAGVLDEQVVSLDDEADEFYEERLLDTACNYRHRARAVEATAVSIRALKQ